MSDFKMHPLHTPEMHSLRMKALGVAGYHQWVADKRGTGRSTANALQALAQAILRPGVTIHVNDHHGTASACRNTAVLAAQLAKALGLQHIHEEYGNLVFENRGGTPKLATPSLETGERGKDLMTVRTLMNKWGIKSAQAVQGSTGGMGPGGERIEMSTAYTK